MNRILAVSGDAGSGVIHLGALGQHLVSTCFLNVHSPSSRVGSCVNVGSGAGQCSLSGEGTQTFVGVIMLTVTVSRRLDNQVNFTESAALCWEVSVFFDRVICANRSIGLRASM